MKLLALLSLLYVGASTAFMVTPSTPLHSRGLNVAALDQPGSSAESYSSSDPQAVIANLFEGLLDKNDAEKHMKMMLHSSTDNWRNKIYDAIGAPAAAQEDTVAAALTHAMRNPDNQFALLVGCAKEQYYYDFTSDVVGKDGCDPDGKCWLECRLYDKKDDELLVVSGWDMELDAATGNWLIDRIDWQDFRDAFYPGLGREEWARAFV